MSVARLPLAGTPIRAAALRRALIAGARRVIARRELLNKINVFPVPDGDTGSNLALTLGAVLSGALQRRAAGVGPLLRRVGDQAVDGARGNSGAILAQFFSGLSEAVGNRRALDAELLAQSVRSAAQSARLAMAQPREGTILSVISAFAEALEARPGVRDLRGWFQEALATAQRALARTPEQLPVLQKAGVVDAGAQGFVDLLEGIADFMARGVTEASDTEADLPDLTHVDVHLEAIGADPDHRYCTECLLVGEGLDRAALHVVLAGLHADCVVLAGNATRLRVHAHVAAPGRMFEALGHFGRVEGSKADDMLAQARSAAGGGQVAVITDSSADLPDGLADALNLHVVPLRVNFGERDYLDKVGLSTAEFYAKLRHEAVRPRTSQPPVGDFRRHFDFLLSHHPSVVYVGLSRAVSGTLQAAEAAAQRSQVQRIHVIDSANAAGGQALLALRAAELARAGARVEQVHSALQQLRPQTRTFAVARDIDHAVRGGRVPRWAGPVVRAFGVTPLARVADDGTLRMAGALWGNARVPERFARWVQRRLPAGVRWRLIVGHCDAAADGAALIDALRQRLSIVDGWLVETGPAVGAHAGPGALVVSVQPAP